MADRAALAGRFAAGDGVGEPGPDRGAGELAEAEGGLGEAERTVTETLSDADFVAMFPALGRAQVDGMSGRPESAGEAAERALMLSRRGAGRVEVAAALLTAARWRRILGRADGWVDDGGLGADLLAEARRTVRACPAPGPGVAAWLAAEERAAGSSRHQADEPLREPLTGRELDILRLLAGPTSQRQLSATLFVSQNTMKSHLRSIYRKLGVASRAEAVLRARELGLL